ncbi:DUF3800 domain-containing protein [Ornithobacterium rhinotracheale]|uniref:DUF3800 domain-containing protein n=1 Tax=Ornithobacterium rhinotracheale TaxID=28251 RepID=UPI00129C9F9D|nr:DUF3800 domain-containing protein [Ornithobacterium rhinotracheale]MRJ11707.1 DUF3800 domain-containing protein [Ornithobacterium rhinotracheale]
MEKKTFNFYCDESCHIERDGFPYMLLSFVSTPYNQLKLHNDRIRSIKRDHNLRGELKWSKLSKSQYECYKEVVKYFFGTDLKFRAIIIDKSKLKHQQFGQSHDDFYDKMYFQLLSHRLNPMENYNIYIDIKDSYSYLKARSLKKYLERDYSNINRLQVIRSYESELMQVTDILMGAISYKLRGLNRVIAKNKIIELIEKNCKKPITFPTPKTEQKFNLFFIDLK